MKRILLIIKRKKNGFIYYYCRYSKLSYKIPFWKGGYESTAVWGEVSRAHFWRRSHESVLTYYIYSRRCCYFRAFILDDVCFDKRFIFLLFVCLALSFYDALSYWWNKTLLMSQHTANTPELHSAYLVHTFCTWYSTKQKQRYLILVACLLAALLPCFAYARALLVWLWNPGLRVFWSSPTWPMRTGERKSTLGIETRHLTLLPPRPPLF